MEVRKGVPVSPGVVIGEAFLLGREDFRIPQRFVKPDETVSEVARYEAAVAASLEEIGALQARVRTQLGETAAQIAGFQIGIVQDPMIVSEIAKNIKEKKYSAEYAVTRAFLKTTKKIEQFKVSYLADRVSDYHDAERRLLRHLLGERREDLKGLTRQVILFAHDLTPTQTADLPLGKVIGFATNAGGRTSHTAILAKQRGLPAVVGLGTITSDVSGGDLVILDGSSGVVIISPSDETIKEYRNRERQFIEFARDLEELRDLPAETLDGYSVDLEANIEFPAEIEAALKHGARGIGLYRTEFLFGEKDPEPSEETQFAAYREAVTRLDGRPLVLRTLDLGADKFTPDKTREQNPFLGCRSIRFCFERIDLWKAQLRAVLRVTAFGNVRIMLPMISSLAEVRKAKRIIQDVMEDLAREGIAFNPDTPIGIMIEVPSAAVVADLLAREVDFFSIGTNDLVQYTLAVDRVNERVANLYQPAHPAVLRLIREVVRAGERHHIDVSLCGEISGGVVYTEPLIGLGLLRLSMSPASIPEVKKVIRSISRREAVKVAETVLTFSDSRETEEYLRERAKKIIPQLF